MTSGRAFGLLVVPLVAGVVLVACSSSGGSNGSSPSPSPTVGRTYTLRAAMTPAQVVAPSGKKRTPVGAGAHATGTFAGTLDAATGRLAWTLKYRGVPPAGATAEMHFGGTGEFGGILVRLCSPCKRDDAGSATIKPVYVADVVRGNTWVGLITPTDPGGALRGQVSASS